MEPRISRETEAPSRLFRGSIEAPLRLFRGKNDIRPRFWRGPSQELYETVPFLRKQIGVDSRFVLPVTAEGVSHRISGSANPEAVPSAAIQGINIFLKVL